MVADRGERRADPVPRRRREAPSAHADREAARRPRPTPRAPGRVAITVEAGDQVFICGINGSGKSRLASRITNALDRFIAYDSKGDDPEAELPNATRAYGVDAALRAIPGRVIYTPTAEEMRDPARHWDRLVEKVWRLGGRCGLLVHELNDLGDADRGFAPYMSVACRQGRSRAITRILVAQRPIDVPRLAVSEAKHYVCFYLQDERDRKSLAAYMGPEVIARQEFSFDYWYCGRGTGMRSVRCSAIR